MTSPRHPAYHRGHPESQKLHDAVVSAITKKYPEVEIRLGKSNLVFKDRVNFASINQVNQRDPGILLSLFGNKKRFQDPRGRLEGGRFPNWSRLKLTSLSDLPYALDAVDQAHRFGHD